MNLLQKYHEKRHYHVNLSPGKIIARIKKFQAQPSSILDSLLYDLPDLRNIKILAENKFEIPVDLHLFGTSGKILIYIQDSNSGSGTEVTTEIIPYNKAYFAALYLVVICLIVWSALVFALWANTNAYMPMLFGWIVLPGSLLLKLSQNRSKSREQRNAFMTLLTKKALS